MIGRRYLLRGELVTVLARWREHEPLEAPPGFTSHGRCSGTPRNVLVEYADGRRVVRPFRGLRRLAEPAPPACYGVPKPNQRAGAHPFVPMDLEHVEAGIWFYGCHVCGRQLLVWADELAAA